jgi:hypothetical protein
MNAWNSICHGDDIAKIYITSDEDVVDKKLSKKCYRYRIVMETKSYMNYIYIHM